MKIISAFVLGAALVAGGAVFAEGEATDPVVKARQALMKTVGANTKVLGDMAAGKTAFDAAAAAEAQAGLVAAAGQITTVFETKADDPESEALPAIWENWADYMTKAEGLKAAAEALDPSSLDTVKAGMAGVGGSCKACHSVYRM